MNYLSELIFGKKTEPAKWENIYESKIVAKYCLHYCPYRYQNSGMVDINPENQVRQWKIDGINNNETYYSSTFPDFNEKIFDTEHYEQVIYNLEKKYTNLVKTNKAINNNNNIEIIKRINPETFNYNDKDYDFSRYEFIVNITEQT